MELERLTAQGLTLIERRNSFEFMRDAAVDLHEVHTGQAWRPRCGSPISRQTLTAAMIDSRDFLQARRRAETEVLLPKGAKIAFAGGVACNDHHRICFWRAVRTARLTVLYWAGSAARISDMMDRSTSFASRRRGPAKALA